MVQYLALEWAGFLKKPRYAQFDPCGILQRWPSLLISSFANTVR